MNLPDLTVLTGDPHDVASSNEMPWNLRQTLTLAKINNNQDFPAGQH